MGIRIYSYADMHMYQMFPTENIRITGCEFDDCGFTGIEVSHAVHAEFDNNRFTNFSNRLGNTSSGDVCGIRTVRWLNSRNLYDQLTKDIKIHDNYFEKCGSVVTVNVEDCEITDNHSAGGMMGIYGGHRVKIYRNTSTEGIIQFGEGEAYHNEDICVPTEGVNGNDCTLRYAEIIHQTGTFRCD
jgi:hypothetical protein